MNKKTAKHKPQGLPATVISAIEELVADKIQGFKFFAKWSASEITLIKGAKTDYIVKQPLVSSHRYVQYGELTGEYCQYHQFYRHYDNPHAISYGVTVGDSTPYHVISYISGKASSFCSYGNDTLVLLGQHLAKLHQVSIPEQFLDHQFYPIAWKNYCFWPRSIMQLYEKQRYRIDTSLLGQIIDSFVSFFQQIPYEDRYCTLIHGDLNPQNVLVKGSQITFIDPYPLLYGDPIIDVGTILFNIELGWLIEGRKDHTAKQQIFLESYLALRPDETILKYLAIVINGNMGQLQSSATKHLLTTKHPAVYRHLEDLVKQQLVKP